MLQQLYGQSNLAVQTVSCYMVSKYCMLLFFIVIHPQPTKAVYTN